MIRFLGDSETSMYLAQASGPDEKKVGAIDPSIILAKREIVGTDG